MESWQEVVSKKKQKNPKDDNSNSNPKVPSLENIVSKNVGNFIAKTPKMAEIIQEKVPHLKEVIEKNISPYDLDTWWTLYSNPNYRPRISYWKYLEQINQFEAAFLQLAYGKELEGKANALANVPLTVTPTSNNIKSHLINVYENYDTFILEPSHPNEKHGRLLFAKQRPFRPPPGSQQKFPSVVSKEEFLEHFRIFTNYQFEGWNQWNNMVVVGGSVSGSLLKVPQKFSQDEESIANFYNNIAYTQSDIDIYIYGLKETEFKNKLYKFHQHLCNIHNKVLIVRTPYTITFCTQYPSRHIQVVIGKWDSIEQVLCESDVDCSAVAFDGTNVWASHRARLSYNTKTNVASEYRYAIRDNPQYETRLIKYSKRGFYITDPKFIWEDLSGWWLKTGFDRINGVSKYSSQVGVNGLRFLILANKHPELSKRMDILIDSKFPKKGLIYGPYYSVYRLEKKLKKKVMIDTNYGPWEIDNPFKLIRENDLEISLKPIPIHNVSGNKWYDHIFKKEEQEERIRNIREAKEYEKIHGHIPSHFEYLFKDKKKKKL